MDEITKQLNGFGQRLNNDEQTIARHDERLKQCELCLPELKTAVETMKEMLHKIQIKQVAVYAGITILVQFIFRYGDKIFPN